METMKQITCLEDTSSFKVYLGGTNSIDAEVFSNIIQNTVSLMKRSVEITNPDTFLKLEIKATSEGSFIAELDAIIKLAPNLLNDCEKITGVATGILTTVLLWLKIKSHLKGKKAKNITISKDSNDAIITNQENENFTGPVNIVKEMFKNNQIDNMIINIFTGVQQENRTNFELIPDKKSNLEKISFTNKEFSNMNKSVVDITEQITRIIQYPHETILLIKKPDLVGNSQWVFLYNKTISATIKDEDFLNDIRTGKISLSGGYQLKCLLQIEYDLEDNELKDNSEKYIITKIIEVIKPSQQKLI